MKSKLLDMKDSDSGKWISKGFPSSAYWSNIEVLGTVARFNPDLDHETCMHQKGMKVWFASDTWFCEDSCHKVYAGLQSRIGLKNLLSDGFSWTLLRCIPGDQKVHSAPRVVALKAECNSKLAVAITIMEECFLPMVDIKTGIDMIPQVTICTSLNYNGFYTVILEKDDVVLSVASIRAVLTYGGQSMLMLEVSSLENSDLQGASLY
ncbi:Increased DNA methylation 1 [Sesamum angolense]|uniref:Increased DNA methylation 1 n=1 Tax=Sesamum angolense TaxID=2727404 RepID=A0AAE1W5E9_9LAMI|nr:Increased DNA methylation 1 [Sesamum angolense]